MYRHQRNMPVSFQIIFISLLIASSCNPTNDPGSIIRAVDTTNIEKENPDYIEQKLRSRQLYKEIMQVTSSEKMVTFVNFIADSLIPCWYGTKWNFNGTTETPKQGTIACGYFVTTVIRDSGIPVQRIKLAQCASEEMIKSVCESETIKRYRNIEFQTFISAITKTGFGLYVIGLDNHTGFIFNDGKKVWFIHSSYISPGCVVKEEASESVILQNSKYKVIGKLRI